MLWTGFFLSASFEFIQCTNVYKGYTFTAEEKLVIAVNN